jgi:hypothetical protein
MSSPLRKEKIYGRLKRWEDNIKQNIRDVIVDRLELAHEND